MPNDSELGDIGRAIVQCFSPRGYGGRADRDISFHVKEITAPSEPHVSELAEAGVMVEHFVPMNCGPGWYYYTLTAKGRRLRRAMMPRPTKLP
jgi:hypothetical protein